MSKPYDMNANSKPQDDAMLAIRLIAVKAGLQVIIIGNEDFETMIEHTRSTGITFTETDCETFKNDLADALGECWMDEAKWAFGNIIESKETK
jgi:hypothetical protein